MLDCWIIDLEMLTSPSSNYTVEPHYNEVRGTMKITLSYQVSHYIRVQKQRNIKSWDQQNYLVIRGFCYIRSLYNEVPLYKDCKLQPNSCQSLGNMTKSEIHLYLYSPPCLSCYFGTDELRLVRVKK